MEQRTISCRLSSALTRTHLYSCNTMHALHWKDLCTCLLSTRLWRVCLFKLKLQRAGFTVGNSGLALWGGHKRNASLGVQARWLSSWKHLLYKPDNWSLVPRTQSWSGELILESCPLISTCAPWHICVCDSNMHITHAMITISKNYFNNIFLKKRKVSPP